MTPDIFRLPRTGNRARPLQSKIPFIMLATLMLPFAAIGWSLLYLLLGGGLFGAILIFLAAKVLRR
jgi:hypothetical protein